MSVIKTNTLLKFENGEYIIDNTHGYIPGVLAEYTDGKMLFVVHKASKFDFVKRQIEWEVTTLLWKPSDAKWIVTDTNNFTRNEQGINRMLIDDTTKVNQQGQIDDNGLVSEIQFYIEALGKTAIFPAIQAGIERRL